VYLQDRLEFVNLIAGHGLQQVGHGSILTRVLPVKRACINHQLTAMAVVYNRSNQVFKFDALPKLQAVAGLSDPVQETRVMLERFTWDDEPHLPYVSFRKDSGVLESFVILTISLCRRPLPKGSMSNGDDRLTIACFVDRLSTTTADPG
jgi:hypothetical protein